MTTEAAAAEGPVRTYLERDLSLPVGCGSQDDAQRHSYNGCLGYAASRRQHHSQDVNEERITIGFAAPSSSNDR